MENPLNSGDSKPQDLKELAEDNKIQDPNGQVEDRKPEDLNEQTQGDKPQDLNGHVEDSKSQDLNGQAENSKPQDLNGEAKDSKPQDLNGQAENSKPQDLNGEAKDSKPQDLNGQAENSKPQDLNGEAKDSKPQELNGQAENSKPQDLNGEAKDSKPQDLNGEAEDSKPQDLNGEAKDSKPQELNGQAENSKPQDLNGETEDSKPQELNGQAESSKPQDLNGKPEDSKVQVQTKQVIEIVVEPPEQLPLNKEEEPSQASTVKERKATMTEWDAKPLSDLIPESSTDTPARYLQPQVEQTTGVPLETLKEESDKEKKQEEEKEKADKEKGEKEAKEPEKIRRVPSSRERNNKIHKAETHSAIVCKPFSHVSGQNSSAARPKGTGSQPVFPKKGTVCKTPTANKATQIYSRSLPLLTRLSLRTCVPHKEKRPSADKATEISPSFERLLKRAPPLVLPKKKQEDKILPKGSLNKSTSTGLPRRGSSSRRSTLGRASGRLRKRKLPQAAPEVPVLRARITPRTSRKQMFRPSLTICPCRRPKVVYNLYVTLCDEWDMDPFGSLGNRWEGCRSCSGLSKACTVFSTLKYGKIHVNDLLLALHTLGILVTSDEMYHSLQFVNVNACGMLNFLEFLEVINKSSPFAETEAFQNALKTFRKMSSGTVATDDLEPTLEDLGVNLSSENVKKALGCTKGNYNGKLDLSEFLWSARELQRSSEMDELSSEYGSLLKTPFQDVSQLVDADSRWRKKYRRYYSEEVPSPTCHRSLSSSLEDDNEGAVQQQRRLSRQPSGDLKTRSSMSEVCKTIVEEDYQEDDIVDTSKFQSEVSRLSQDAMKPLRSSSSQENN